VYYDLEATSAQADRNGDVGLRLESLCPFPFGEVIAELKQYSNATVTWAQEEPKNAGGWLYLEPRMRNILEYMEKERSHIKNDEVSYAGRPIMAATAVGYAKTHNE
jgi:2-oxoglutarate dehydrogenase E1 component